MFFAFLGPGVNLLSSLSGKRKGFTTSYSHLLFNSLVYFKPKIPLLLKIIVTVVIAVMLLFRNQHLDYPNSCTLGSIYRGVCIWVISFHLTNSSRCCFQCHEVCHENMHFPSSLNWGSVAGAASRWLAPRAQAPSLNLQESAFVPLSFLWLDFLFAAFGVIICLWFLGLMICIELFLIVILWFVDAFLEVAFVLSPIVTWKFS